jgi:hypothetical protein
MTPNEYIGWALIAAGIALTLLSLPVLIFVCVRAATAGYYFGVDFYLRHINKKKDENDAPRRS